MSATCSRTFLILVVSLSLSSAAAAQTLQGGVAFGQQPQPLWSRPGPSEVDTAALADGQVGGHSKRDDYQIGTLRCQAGTVLVGLRVRRGDVLDAVQIGCGSPQASASGYGWDPASLQWEAAAGNLAGGDPQTAMQCAANSALTGIQGRAVVFTQSDYAADLAIECSPLASTEQGSGLFAVGLTAASWYHPQSGVGAASGPPNAIQTIVTGAISCRPNGAATAVTYATSGFVNTGQQVIQAVSLFCPANPIPPMQSPADVLPAGAVGPQDPRRAPEVGGPGVIGSFPNTTKMFELCYTYCTSINPLKNVPVLGVPVADANTLGSPLPADPNELKSGDVLVFFMKLGNQSSAIPSHYATYTDNRQVYYKNGFSDIYVAKLPDYLTNFPSKQWIIRVY